MVNKADWLFDLRNVDDMASQLHSAWVDQLGRGERAKHGLVRAQTLCRR